MQKKSGMTPNRIFIRQLRTNAIDEKLTQYDTLWFTDRFLPEKEIYFENMWDTASVFV